SKNVNWYHPFLWLSINAAIRKACWSCEGAVKLLYDHNPMLYSHLHCGTIFKWKKKGEHECTDATIRNVTNHHTLSGSRRAGTLAKFPDLVNNIKEVLQALCALRLVVNVMIAWSMALGLIQECKDFILTLAFPVCSCPLRTHI
ncbi:hypothetical protein BT96DRAFT_834923, partial [Gymnopus androsaceus JB14]